MSLNEPRVSELQVVLSGIAFGESPRWHDGRLWFSDWGAKQVLAVDADGYPEVIVQVDFPSFPMCIDFLPDGRLLIVSGREGRVLRRDFDGSLVTHADLGRLADKQHPWNDIVVDGRGNAYINNQGFDFPGGEFAPGTIALLTPDGSARQVADGIAFPNGMAVTPDNGTLICAESYGHKLTGFDIAPDGGLSNKRVWAALGDGTPDGICVDRLGAVWYADVPNQRCVHVAEGGEVLDTIELDRGAFACMLGGADGRTLFVVGQQWTGPENMQTGPRTGELVAARVSASRAGWP
jgi:sugar lactone lactonase YvrE